jgi:hypothetical protein
MHGWNFIGTLRVRNHLTASGFFGRENYLRANRRLNKKGD